MTSDDADKDVEDAVDDDMEYDVDNNNDGEIDDGINGDVYRNVWWRRLNMLMMTFKNDDVDGCLWRCLVATSDYVDNNAEGSEVEVAVDDDVDCDVDETMVVTSHGSI